MEQSETQKGLMTAALRGRSRTRRGELGGETEPCRSGGIPQRRDSALSCGRLGAVWRPARSRKAPEKAFTGRDSKGLPAGASPVPAAHRGCCRRTRDLQRAAHAESVLWRREGERAEFEGRWEGERLWLPSATQQSREKADEGQRPPRDTGCLWPRLRQRSVIPSARRERNGRGSQAPVWHCLESPTASLPPLPACFFRPGDPAVRAWVRAGAAAGSSGRAPRPGTRALPRLEKPRPPALLALLPFPSDSTMISYLKKLIFLPGRSEAINRLLYIMFSYSSRLPLPSTDSL